MPFFWKDHNDAFATLGDVAIIIDEGVACWQIQLWMSLEAVAVQALLFNKLVTITSICIPPSTEENFRALSMNFPNPV